MRDSPTERAVQVICKEDGMSDEYRTRLTALIYNAMRDSIDPGDIDDLLKLIPEEEPSDEG